MSLIIVVLLLTVFHQLPNALMSRNLNLITKTPKLISHLKFWFLSNFFTYKQSLCTTFYHFHPANARFDVDRISIFFSLFHRFLIPGACEKIILPLDISSKRSNLFRSLSRILKESLDDGNRLGSRKTEVALIESFYELYHSHVESVRHVFKL